MNIATFLRTPILKNTCEWLILEIQNSRYVVMHALNVYSLCSFYKFFFIGNQVAKSLTLKVKQLAKQLPSLKTLLKKISVEL